MLTRQCVKYEEDSGQGFGPWSTHGRDMQYVQPDTSGKLSLG